MHIFRILEYSVLRIRVKWKDNFHDFFKAGKSFWGNGAAITKKSKSMKHTRTAHETNPFDQIIRLLLSLYLLILIKGGMINCCNDVFFQSSFRLIKLNYQNHVYEIIPLK